jgi:6,7-dimethyl-8-ribityllumazine synthase
MYESAGHVAAIDVRPYGSMRPDYWWSGGAMSSSTPRRQSATQPANAPDGRRVAFIQSCWHREIVDQARLSFLSGMGKSGYQPANLQCFEVPGAFEIPLQAKLLAKSGHFSAVVAAAFVVDGGIYRHEFVASAVVNALMTIQLETEIPVISVILTPKDFHEHAEHLSFFKHHFAKKGSEAAAACVATISAIYRPVCHEHR